MNAILIDWFAAAREDAKLQEHIAALLQVTGSYSVTGAPGMPNTAGKRLPEESLCSHMYAHRSSVPWVRQLRDAEAALVAQPR